MQFNFIITKEMRKYCKGNQYNTFELKRYFSQILNKINQV
jgi:hypothetical protein